MINANNYNAADHEALIKKAIKAHPDTKWRIVVMHQDIYGSGKDHSDSDGILLRTQLTPIYDANKIDVVLQGHDHTYARTYQISGDGKQHADFSEYKVAGQQGQHHNLIGVRRTPSSTSRRRRSPSIRMMPRQASPSTRRIASSKTDPAAQLHKISCLPQKREAALCEKEFL